jgi:hypothetical protein
LLAGHVLHGFDLILVVVAPADVVNPELQVQLVATAAEVEPEGQGTQAEPKKTDSRK